MIEDARNLLDALHTERLEYYEYRLLRDALDELEADRDKWKTRAEALERFARDDCDCCKYDDVCRGGCNSEDMNPYSWEFDEAKFKEGE